MKKTKIAILGGAGFIGHNLALELSKNKSYEILIIDNLGVNNLKAKFHTPKVNKRLLSSILKNRLNLLKKNKLKTLDINIKNFNLLKKKMISFKPNYIFHLAAVSHANISNIDPKYTFDNSVDTLLNTLEIVKILNCHLIYLSSSMVYGNFNGKKVNENTKCDPLGIYGNFKFMCERMIQSYHQVFNTKYTIIRPSALYGERCISRRVGQIFIENALMNKTIEINGNGDEKLDFTYIKDFVSGIKKIINNKKSVNQIFNLTYGSGRKINDLLKILKQYFPNLKVKYANRDKLTPIRGTLSNTKVRNLLKHKSKFSIDKGYTSYIQWYLDFFKKNKRFLS